MAIMSSLVFVSLGSIAILSQQQPPTTAYAQQQLQAFIAKLTGKDEVPAVGKAQAISKAQFQLNSDGNEINYDLTTTNLNSFTIAHVHQGKTGENGPPVAELQMGKGKIASSDLQGPLAGRQIPDLIDLMKNGGSLCQCSYPAESKW